MTISSISQQCLVLLLCVVVCGCSAASGSDEPIQELTGSDEPLQELTGGNLQTIKFPDSVVVKRIKSTRGAEQALSEFKPLAGEQLKQIQTLLSDTDSFEWDSSKDCMLSPGVLIVFSKGSAKSEVRICFDCLMLGFTPGNWEDFDPVEKKLIDWAKSVFPNDEEIASLKQRK